DSTASQILTCTKMANEYVLPKERITVNKIFVDIICKGHRYTECIDITANVEQSVSFKGRKLKLGPDITKITSIPQQMDYLHKVSNEIQPIVKDIHNTGNPYVQPNHYPGVLTFVMSTYIPQPVYMFQNATAQWTVGNHTVKPWKSEFY
uniref:Uncharacterized protein n=1 Tax=Erpetoichthys calabaricus TaxID=27687 RepID=A0A8C4RCR6_ERPCA